LEKASEPKSARGRALPGRVSPAHAQALCASCSAGRRDKAFWQTKFELVDGAPAAVCDHLSDAANSSTNPSARRLQNDAVFALTRPLAATVEAIVGVVGVGGRKKDRTVVPCISGPLVPIAVTMAL